MTLRSTAISASTVAGVLLACALLYLAAPTPADAGDRFTDVPAGHTFHDDISWLSTEGVTRGCNPPANTQFCPDEIVTRGQMAAFLVRALGLGSSEIDFSDTAGHVFEADVSSLAAAGITRGCNPPANNRFCPDDPVTRGQMAAFLNRALDLAPGTANFFDISDSVFIDDIGALAAAGVTRGCNPPSNTLFCPDNLVTRAQMAAFLRRGIEGGSEPVAPSVLLKGDGLGVTEIGDPIGTSLPTLVASLGEPDEDTGWLPSWGQFGACPGEAVRGVRWGHLQTVYVRSSTGIGWAGLPAGEVFLYYTHSEGLTPGPITPSLTTDRGIGLRDTVADLRAAYGPDVTITYDDIFEYWRYSTADGHQGSVTGGTDSDFIYSIGAGVFCGE